MDGRTRTRSHKLALRLGSTLVLAGALGFGLAACDDDDDVTGTERGEVSASVTDDPSSTSGSIARASFLDILGLQASGSFSGTMTADATVEIRNSAGTFIDLGSASNADLEMQSEGGEITVATGTSVDAGTYTAVRLTLENATTTVQAGSSIGGIVLDVDVLVNVGGEDNTVVIEKEMNVDVDAGSSTTVVFDLNAESWIDQAAVDSEMATDADIQAATTAFVAASG